jgi:mannose-1-phosphate guanylyltransferase
MNSSEQHRNTFAVIMAGGVGTRFWPMSRSARPKQFLDILGTGRSLIQMTYERLVKLVPAENIVVVTQERYRGLVAEHLPALPAENVLCEPFMRNTAPCIAYANHWVAARTADPADTAMIVAPADHLILDESGFLEIASVGLDLTRNTQQLVTLGIKPSRPDTGYGYIQFEDLEGAADSRVRAVKTFTEKPNLELAEQFLASGDFYWNSGIFIWSLANIQAAFDAHLPDMQALFEERASDFATEAEGAAIASIYGDCENISIDYGVMEKAPNVAVVLSDFGWSDLGTWGSVHEKLPLDEAGNGVAGVTLDAQDASGNVIVSDIPGKLVAVRGLENFIVVDTADALLVCPKAEEQWIKQLVTRLKVDRGEPII